MNPGAAPTAKQTAAPAHPVPTRDRTTTMPLRPLPIRDPERSEREPQHARVYDPKTGGWAQPAPKPAPTARG